MPMDELARLKIRNYITKRYQEDPEFRQRYLGHIAKYQDKIKRRNHSIKLNPVSKLKCAYCGYIWKPKVSYIPHICPSCHRIQVKLPIILKEGKHETNL